MDMENSNNQDLPEERHPTTLSGRRRPRDDDNSSPSPDEKEIIRKQKLQKVAVSLGLKPPSTSYKEGRLASFTAAEEAFTTYQIGRFLSHYDVREKEEADRTGKPVDDARCAEIFQSVKESRQWYETRPYKRRVSSMILLMYQTKMEIKELKHTARGMWNHRIAEGFRVWIADRVGGEGKLHETNHKARKEHDDIVQREYVRVFSPK